MLNVYREEHPELKVSKLTRKKVLPSRSGPTKPLKPFRMFMQDKIKQLQEVDNELDLNTLQSQCNEKWKSMSNKKKIPWIRWAHEAEMKYLVIKYMLLIGLGFSCN